MSKRQTSGPKRRPPAMRFTVTEYFVCPACNGTGRLAPEVFEGAEAGAAWAALAWEGEQQRARAAGQALVCPCIRAAEQGRPPQCGRGEDCWHVGGPHACRICGQGGARRATTGRSAAARPAGQAGEPEGARARQAADP